METMEAKDAKTVVVGVTGRIDSMVATYLLKKQGYNCIAVSVVLSDFVGPYYIPASIP